MTSFALFAIIILYLAFLFLIAFFAEKNKRSKWVHNPIVYTLSFGVYCSAWTYYGSVGEAAEKGVRFLAIYLGPIIAAPLWIILLKKVIQISKQHKISSLADFISLRYGKNRFLGALVTVVCLIAIIPYISLQLKAVSETFEIMTQKSAFNSNVILTDSTFYIALILAVFAALFGTQTTDASEKRRGIIFSIAFESLVKWVFFIVIGIYCTYFLFDGATDIVTQFKHQQDIKSLITINGFEGGYNWFFTIMLSFMAVFLLPRQFQVAVIENTREKHLKTAIWLFPLYLLLFNVFVVFIAWAGKIKLGNAANAEYFTLLLPLSEGNILLAILVFLGGLSAVISMVIVSSLALSIMISNNLIIPYGFLSKFVKSESDKNVKFIKNIRRVAIFFIIIVSYLLFYSFSEKVSLYAIGLISFVIIAQLAPSFFMGLFWNRGSSKGAIIGIFSGLIITFYTLLIPFLLETNSLHPDFLNDGLFSIHALKPYALFGIDFLSAPSHAFLWSITLNSFCYVYFSLSTTGNYRERNYAEMFVDNNNFKDLQDNAFVWKGEAYVKDIKEVLMRFLGSEKATRALNIFFTKYNLPKNTQFADAKLIHFSEQLLTGSIGSASSKILIQSVVKEEEISLVEVLHILEESKEAIAKSKAFKEKSLELSNLAAQLKLANQELLLKDKQKDEFLDTIAHELKTPLTGIRATTEILLDDAAMPTAIKEQFLKNMLQDSERLSRLIHTILDFEKLASEHHQLSISTNNIASTIATAIASIKTMANKKNCSIIQKSTYAVSIKYDEDRMIQVFTNLLSNAIKFCEPIVGEIIIAYCFEDKQLKITISDNGKGVSEEDQPFIFDKFFQSKNQNTIKPIGTGLGLAICKQIIEKHQGSIWLDTSYKNGAMFHLKMPLKQ